MMLHAVALGAEINYQHENDQGRTPLIQTVLSVRFEFFFLFNFNKNVLLLFLFRDQLLLPNFFCQTMPK